MADRSVSIRLGVNVTGVTAGFSTATKAAQDFASKGLAAVGKNQQHISNLSNTMGLLGVAMVGAAGLAVKKFADFDQAMSNVAATGKDARGSIEALRTAALDAGAASVFSASEAAGAIEELAKAGVSAADILGGGLDGALDLAAAGGIGVADAAGIAATALKVFNLRGSDMSHVADLLAAGAGKAMGGVDDLGAALKQGGIVAEDTGLSIEETTGALSAFASAGLLGSDAGTSLKMMLQRLTPQSKEAQEKFDELGISAYDASGQFIGLDGLAGQLRSSMEGLTPEARNAALAVMFGSDAVRAASVLYDEGQAGIAGWTSAVDDQGYAAETAGIRLGNLKGDLEAFTGSLDSLLIGMGEGANGPMRGLVQSATDVTNAFGKIPSGAQNALLGIVGIGGLAVLGLAGMGKLVVGINDAKVAMKTLGITAKTATVAIGLVGGALAIATIGITAWASASAEADAKVDAIEGSLDGATNAITNNTREIVKNDLATKQGWWIFKKQSAFDGAKILGLSLETVTDAAMGNADALKDVKEATTRYQGDMEGLGDAAEAAGVGIGDYANAQGNVEAAVLGSNESIDEAIRLAQMKAQADGSATGDQEGLSKAVDGTTVAIGAATKAGESLSEAQVKWREEIAKLDGGFVGLATSYDTIVQKNKDVATATAESTDSSTDSWEDFYDGFSMSVTDYLAELQAQVDAQSAWETNMLLLSGKVSQTTIDELARMGTEGAPLVAQLVDASDAELARLEGLVKENVGEATGAFAETLDNSAPVIAWAAANLGDGAAKEIAGKLAAGTATVEQIMADYGVTISAIRPNVVVTLDTWQAETRLKTFKEALARDDFVITAEVRKENGYYAHRATGGAMYGPGTGTSDSIPAMLSHGEHVLTADDVKDVGGQAAVYRLRSMIQAGALRLAGGGGVWSPNFAHHRGRMNVNTQLPDVAPSGGGMGDGSGSGSKLVAFGRLIQGRGFSVSEHPAFGGVRGRHMNGSKHYLGRAIDVNAGAGTSLAEQRALASIIGLSKSYGLNNIFMKKGHYNHAHFDFMNGGYTGPGAKHKWAGNVHKGEFVMNSDVVNPKTLPMFDAINDKRVTLGSPHAYAQQSAPSPTGSGAHFRDLVLNEVTDMAGTARAVTRRLAMAGKA